MSRKTTLYLVGILVCAGLVGWCIGTIVNYYFCQGQCAHGNKHCQQLCLDRGYCPRERE